MKARQGSSPRGREAQGIIVLVDVVLVTLLDRGLGVLLHEREKAPFKGVAALPGGYVRPEEDRTPEDAARRVLEQKVGIEAPYLEQLATYGGPDRDPGGWSVSIAYFALVPNTLTDLPWTPVSRLPATAFDHRLIIQDAVERIRTKSAYSALPAHLAGSRFTLSKLQSVFERVLGKPIDKVSFRRRMEEIGALREVPGAFERPPAGQAGRPAQVYELRQAEAQRNAVLQRGLGGR